MAKKEELPKEQLIVLDATRDEDIHKYIDDYNESIKDVVNRKTKTTKEKVFYSFFAVLSLIAAGLLFASGIKVDNYIIVLMPGALFMAWIAIKLFAIAFTAPPQIHKRTETKSEIDTLEKELKKKHIEYRNVALTDNYVVALDEASSKNGKYTAIKYSDIVWIYNDTVADVIKYSDSDSPLTTAQTGDEERAAIVIRSKSRKTILIIDHQYRLHGTLWSHHTHAKLSDELKEIFEKVIKRAPDGTMIGNDNFSEDDYLKIVEENDRR